MMEFKEEKKRKLKEKSLRQYTELKVERKIISQRSKGGFNEILKTIQFMEEYSMLKDRFLHRKLFPVRLE